MGAYVSDETEPYDERKALIEKHIRSLNKNTINALCVRYDDPRTVPDKLMHSISRGQRNLHELVQFVETKKGPIHGLYISLNKSKRSSTDEQTGPLNL